MKASVPGSPSIFKWSAPRFRGKTKTRLFVLSPSEKATLVDALVEEPFEQGTPIVKQGEQGNAFYIIKAGGVRVESTNAEGGTTLIREHLGPSDYLALFLLLFQNIYFSTW